MDKRKKLKISSPRQTANIFSKLVFWWLKPLFFLIKNNNFKSNNLWDVRSKDRGEILGNELEMKWKREVDEVSKENGRKPSLWRAILKVFKWNVLVLMVSVFILDTIRIINPLIVSLFIGHYLSSSTTTSSYMISCISSFLLLFLIEIIFARHLRFQEDEIGTRLRTACSSLIYKKIIRLSCSTTSQVTKEMIINLFTKDATSFEKLFVYIHYIWITPLQITVIIYLIYRHFGVASLAGVSLMLFQAILVQAYCNNVMSELQLKIEAWTNERMSLMTEILNKIRVIKIYCWEKPIEKVMYLTRRYEIDILKVASCKKGVNLATFVFSEQTSLFLTILVHTLTQNILSADKVFSTALFFLILRRSLTSLYPNAVTTVVRANISVNRIQKFLLLEEVEQHVSLSMLSNDNSTISIKNVNASWIKAPNAFSLQNIDICMTPKELYIVTGPTGAGKSSFLHLILGELRPSTGDISVNGSISYASQEAWIFPGTIRNNILCSEIYEEDKYIEITKICDLTEFFEGLPLVDETFIGDEKSVLSIEYCSKINLARALYKDADIYLIDDSFTLLGNKMFEDCIVDLLKDKTRIVATSRELQHLKDANKIILLNQGKVEFVGSFSSFENSDKFVELKKVQTNTTVIKEPKENKNINFTTVLTSKVNIDTEKEYEETEGLLRKKSVLKSLYWKYFKSGGSSFTVTISLLFFAFSQLSICGSDYWITQWTNQEELYFTSMFNEKKFLNSSLEKNQENENVTIAEKEETFIFPDTEKVLYVYGGFILGAIVFSIIRNAIFFKICLTASERIHNNIFARFIKAPMQFFYANPKEKILYQFSNDMGQLDENLSRSILDVSQTFFAIIGIGILLIISDYCSILPILLTAFLYFKLYDLYLLTIPKVTAIEQNVKKENLSHVNSALSGLSSIRCSRAQKLLLRSFSDCQDRQTAGRELVAASAAAFGLWLDLLFTLLLSLVSCSLVLMGRNGVDAAFVGLAMMELALLKGLGELGMKSSEYVMAQRSRLEKAFKCSELKQEGSDENTIDEKELKSWPTEGDIKFDHLYAKYGEDDEPVLKNFNFTIEAGSKVVIIQNAITEKSSLTSALFRLASIEGSLIIDGVDTKNVGLGVLRNRISLVSQESVFFSDTPRDNLDIFHEFDDDVLWSALEVVKLNRIFSSLDHSCSYLSPDRRKLLSLARAIIKKSKILVIEEMAKDVDQATEDLVRQIVRTEFKDSTVITITRKSNIMRNFDCDKFVVLNEDGEATEFECSDGALQQADLARSNQEFNGLGLDSS